MSDERQQKLEERLVWLEASIGNLRRNYERSPYFSALVLLALPAYLVGGAGAAFLLALMVVAFVSVLIYVAWSHVHENEAELKSVRAELRRLGSRAS
jgi:hypothetical protein